MNRGVIEPAPRRSIPQRILDSIELAGNRVPHPAVIFLILCGVVIAASQIFHWMGASATYQQIDPATQKLTEKTVVAQGLLTAEGIRYIMTSVVANFLGFAPVGVVFVAMVGVGLAEEAGLIRALVRKIVQIAPPSTVTFIVCFLGILSSVAQDAGYLVLIPLGAAAFYSLGRHPLAGMAAAFAGVAGVFGVNLVITPTDAILTEITNDAIHLFNPHLSIAITANIYFSIASSLLLCVVCTLVTERLVEPRLGKYTGSPELVADKVPEGEGRGLRVCRTSRYSALRSSSGC